MRGGLARERGRRTGREKKEDLFNFMGIRLPEPTFHYAFLLLKAPMLLSSSAVAGMERASIHYALPMSSVLNDEA